MTDRLFFDTDCISSFLWTKAEHLLLQLYPGRIIFPKEVFVELSNPSIPHIKRTVDKLCSSGDIAIKEILTDTDEYALYYELAISPPKGERRIGRGEAAAIALAKVHNGILASNNLKDISKYVKKYDLEHIATADILAAALKAGYLDEDAGNEIWVNMLSKRRILPANSFSDYLKNHLPPS